MRIRLLATLPFALLAACDGPSSTTDAALGDAAVSDAPFASDAGPADAHVAWDVAQPDASLPMADVHFVGRFDPSTGADTPRFALPGSEIVAHVAGPTITVDLENEQSLFFEATIDGMRGAPFAVDVGSGTYTLASGLADTEHEVHLVRRNESFAGTTRFLGFGSAALVPSPAPYTRLLEFIGDSITCGYGATGPGPSCSFTYDTESEPDAYAAVAARELDAGHVSVAVSGIGLTMNYGGETTGLMGERYLQTWADGPAWAFSYTPDAVVISLGTNDFWDGDPGTAFADALDALVRDVRGRYASAEIFLATSPMLGGTDFTTHQGYLADVVDRASGRGDTRVHRIDLPTQSADDGLGCDWHPSVATHALNGHRVAEALRPVLGW